MSTMNEARERECLKRVIGQMYDELVGWWEGHPEASFPEDYRFVTR